MRFLFALLVFASPLAAQQFDLETLPADFRFTDHGSDGDTVVSYDGRMDDAFVFRYIRTDPAGSVAKFTGWTNRASQTVSWRSRDGIVVAVPHDCWPTIGSCDYSVIFADGGIVDFHASMIVIGDIWEHRRYVEIGGIVTLVERGCTRMDEYGFPIDNWTENRNGEVEWSERVTTMGQPDPRSDLQSLITFCKNQQDLVS